MQLDTLNNEASLDSGEIAHFLLNNPGFFEQHPHILPRLDIPHPSGAAVSLIERQVIALRSRCQELENRLRNLIAVAQDNEKLHQGLHRLTQEIVSAATLNEALRVTAKGLKMHLRADSVRFLLIRAPHKPAVSAKGSDVAAAKARTAGTKAPAIRPPRALKGLSRFVKADDPCLAEFAEHFAGSETICGPLNEQQLAAVFAGDSHAVVSAAVIPLQYQDRLGVMVLGSECQKRFAPGMGVMFLNQLGEVLSRRLHTLRQP